MSIKRTEAADLPNRSLLGQIIIALGLSLAALTLGGVIAAGTCLAVLLLVRFQVGSETAEKHGIAQFPSSRLGGVVVVGYLLGSSFWLYWVNGVVLLDKSQLAAALVCLGIFFVGLLEDITGTLTAITRLLIIGCLVSLLLWFDPVIPINTTGWAAFDRFFSVPFFATLLNFLGILFLIIASNTVDGANGLLAGTALISLWVLMQLSSLWILIPIWTGLMVFFLINIATGKLFLGDSGAYFIGTVLAIALIYTASQQVTTIWLLVTLVFYPTADFLFTLLRRLCCGGSLMSADNAHFHNMLHDELDAAGWPPSLANSLTGLFVVLLWSAPTLVLFEVEVPALTWVWLYVIYWVVFIAMWHVFSRRRQGQSRI